MDGGILGSITINNLTMMDMPDYAIYITTGKRDRGPAVKNASVCRNISISDVIADNVGRTSSIEIMGLPDHPVEGTG